MSPSQSQKQSSISAFFKRKSPPPTLPSAPRGSASIGISHFSVQTMELDEDEDDIVAIDEPPVKKKARTSTDDVVKAKGATSSSYFGKKTTTGIPASKQPTAQRSSSGNAHASSSTSAVLPKSSHPKSRPSTQAVNLASYRLPRTVAPPPSESGSAFGNYSVTLESTPLGESSTQARAPKTAEQEARHEKWQTRVMGSGGIRPRRRSLALDEAAAAEARGGLAAEGGEDGDADGGDAHAVEIGDEAQGSEDERAKAASGVGSKLAAKFGAKAKEDPKGKAKAKGRTKKKEEEIGPSGLKYTPLEKQFMEIKKENQDVLLLMEVGYKYKFHGEDAKTASRELGIAAFPSRNFYTASIPTHRMHIHVKKLISLGYKVGVISQTETAALKKVSDNRNAPFTRSLTHLFTAATWVEDAALGSASTMMDDPVVPGSAPPPTNALVAIVEIGMGGMASDERVRIGLVSVVPETGDVVWDEFDDSQVRTELETRLTHLQPAELLLPATGLSKATEKVLSHFAGNTKTSASSKIRTERIDKILPYNKAFDFVTKFYSQSSGSTSGGAKKGRSVSNEIDLTGSDDEMPLDEGEGVDEMPGGSQANAAVDPIGLASGLPSEEAVLAIVDFPKQVVVAFSVIIQYMKAFGLQDAFRHRSSFTKFINRAHMLLSSNTLVNLEIYRNQDDGGVYGSLVWLLDHTKTRMGRRLLREWIGRPLLDVIALQARIDAIEEIIENKTYHIEKMRSLLVNMPDLVKGLTRVQYGKASASEVANLLVALVRIGAEFKPSEGRIFKSGLLNQILNTLPTILEPARAFLDAIDSKKAHDGTTAEMWSDPDKFPDIQDAQDCISICLSELNEHLKEVREVSKRPTSHYVSVAGIDYLIEIPVNLAKTMPPKWVKVQSTKHVVRFHTPEILRITAELEQHKETLSIAAKAAFASFQSDISECHSLVVVSRQLAVIDCLMSLAQVAAGSGYCKPTFTGNPELHIRAGRHPMVEMLKDEAYVPFDIDFSEEEGCAKVITGPNMAGKSSCVRATALIVCMAQIGSFVPASSVTLGVHDAVQTRMGASDEIGRGKSTFMVELSETSDILRTLTPRTLVILDELGRGTSTYDGVAIAYATLSHVAAAKCNTLFVTHYPTVAEELAREFPTLISNWHMGFEETKLPDGSAEITFLYRLTRGLAEASFGVWCARLAGLPKSVLENAQLRSDVLKADTQKKAAASLARRVKALLSPGGGVGEQAGVVLRNARTLSKLV